MEKCPITELKLERIDITSYRIQFNNEYLFIRHGIRFDSLINSEIFKKTRHVIAGAILNKQLSDGKQDDVYWFTITNDNLEEKLNDIVYPKTPKDKLDNLFNTLYNLQSFEGEVVELYNKVIDPGFWYKHYFRSQEECYFYVKNLDSFGFINCLIQKHTGIPIEYHILYKGLEHFLKINELGNLSKKCFVAMSFGKEMSDIRRAIKTAIDKTGYDPIIIDEEHIDCAQTINDAIIGGLKSAKFCIADFTEQRNGVYFESGYALGQGKPVIYCCKEDHFKHTHFDTNHFAHIIYDTPEELQEKLINKIAAWIK